jgi:putative peptidoglycan lipid II flippase
VPVALVNALFPLMAVQAAAGPGGPLGRTYAEAVRVLGLLALPLAAGTALLARPIVAVVYGLAYAAAAPVLAILVWGLAVLYLNAPVGNVILGSDRAARYLPWAALHTGATVGVTAALASRLGATGAAIAFVAAEVAGFGLQCWFVRSLVGRLPDFPRLLARPALATLAMALAVAGLAGLGSHLFVLVPAGMLVYFGGLLALGEIGERDQARVRQWLGRRRSGASVGAGRSGGG